MQPYQEEYIANLKDITLLSSRRQTSSHSLSEYQEKLLHDRSQLEERINRNIELLRDGLFPLFDRLFEAPLEELTELEIYQALLSRARHTKDRNAIIRCLYWLGIGRHHMCNKMVGIDLADIEFYMSQMRLCFAEAAAYLKYFDEIDDTDTKGYILRSRANTALGQFKSASAKIV